MSEPTIPIRFTSLGMREDLALGTEEPAYADMIRNMDHDPEGYWEASPGTANVGDWLNGTGAILALIWFQPRPGLRWLVTEQVKDDASSELLKVNWPVGDQTVITTRRRLANGPGGQFIEHGRWLYHLNGLEQPVRWDGDRVVPFGYQVAPPAPQAIGPDQGFAVHDRLGLFLWPNTWPADGGAQAYQRGVGEFPSSADAYFRIGYAIAYVNDLGQQSPVSAIAWVSGHAATGDPLKRFCTQIGFSGAPDHVRAVIMYRTRNVYGVTGSAIDNAADLYEHSRFETAAGWTFIDLLSDSELGPVFDRDSVGPVPPNASVGAFWQGSFWLAAEGLLHYSSPGLHEQFPSQNRLPVGATNTGNIVALRPIPRGLLVWTERATFIVKGTPLEGYVVQTLSDVDGCVARNSIESIPGMGIAWLAAGGPRIMTGILEADLPTGVTPIKGIRKTWRRTAGNLSTAFVLHDPERRYVWWHIAEGGNVMPEFGIVWHYGIDSWSIRPSGDWPIACAYRYMGRIYVGSHDDSLGGKDFPAGVHVLTRGYATRFAQARIGQYFSGFLGGETRSLVQYVVLHVLGMGGATVALEYRGDRAAAFTAQADTDRLLDHAEEQRDVWGVGNWGASHSWGDHEPAAVSIPVDRNNSFVHQWRIRGERLRLIAIEAHVDNQGAPVILPRQGKK